VEETAGYVLREFGICDPQEAINNNPFETELYCDGDVD
jgi:hypothetical protein